MLCRSAPMMVSDEDGAAPPTWDALSGCIYAHRSNVAKCSSYSLLSRMKLCKHMHAVMIIVYVRVSGKCGIPSRMRHFILRTPNALSLNVVGGIHCGSEEIQIISGDILHFYTFVFVSLIDGIWGSFSKCAKFKNLSRSHCQSGKPILEWKHFDIRSRDEYIINYDGTNSSLWSSTRINYLVW